MKSLLNWRYYVLFAVFAAGMLLLAAAFGEPEDKAMGDIEWLLRVIALLCGSAVCFYVLHRCVKHWSEQDKIS